MLLNWRLHHNPIYNSASPLYLDLSAHCDLTQAQFSTLADGGFGDGSLGIGNATDELVRRAAQEWLMKRVVATDRAGRIAYEGFIAEVDAQSGTHRYLRTMDGFANRMYGKFQWAGTDSALGRCPSGAQCLGRVQREESHVGSSTTQTDLGIKEEWLDLKEQGVITRTQAQNKCDARLLGTLSARALDLQFGEGASAPPPQITLAVWGYYATLGWRKQNLRVATNTELKTIVETALTRKSVAPFLSADFSQLPTTGKTIQFNSSGDWLWLQDYIVQALSNASPNQRRLFFQVWEGRRAFLLVRETAPKYFSRSDDERLFDSGRGVIPPYMVRAGGYVVAENADIALDSYSDVIGRNYAALVETTTYDDVAEHLAIPPPGDLAMTSVRLLARQKRNQRA